MSERLLYFSVVVFFCFCESEAIEIDVREHIRKIDSLIHYHVLLEANSQERKLFTAIYYGKF